MTRNLQQLVNRLPAEWQTLLEPFAGELLSDIQTKIDQDATQYEGLGIYPKPENTLQAFHYHPPDKIKVVIIGQDCYHQPGKAIGLCFGIPPDTNIPPSLLN
jgi:uracil-DNA glycosylase